MSRLGDVIKSKNRLAKTAKRRRQEEISNMRTLSMYKVRLINDLKIVQMMFDDDDVESVKIKIPKSQLSYFLKVIYSEELGEYTISQLDENTFEVSRREVNF